MSDLQRRDLNRFAASCRVPHTAAGYLTRSIDEVGASLARVLVVDGRCYCKNNGIGNLFGDYVVWFNTAALTGRALFVDWTDSARKPATMKMHKNETECMASGVGFACPRVPRPVLCILLLWPVSQNCIVRRTGLCQFFHCNVRRTELSPIFQMAVLRNLQPGS